MLIVRSEQLDVLAQKKTEEFIDRLVELLSDESFIPEDMQKLREECTLLFDRAKEYGLETEFEVATFVSCGVLYGARFDVRPELPFMSILTEPNTEARLKAAQMAVVLERADKDAKG